MSTAAQALAVRPRRVGFTLIELMIIVTLLGILAALAYPVISSNSDQARTEALASNVAHIRALLVYHAGVGDTALSSQGFPAAIEPAWFRDGALPEHAWTARPLNVQTVNAAAGVCYPASKTFDPNDPSAASAWYNSANGWFCALVPAQSSDADSGDVQQREQGQHHRAESDIAMILLRDCEGV